MTDQVWNRGKGPTGGIGFPTFERKEDERPGIPFGLATRNGRTQPVEVLGILNYASLVRLFTLENTLGILPAVR